MTKTRTFDVCNKAHFADATSKKDPISTIHRRYSAVQYTTVKIIKIQHEYMISTSGFKSVAFSNHIL